MVANKIVDYYNGNNARKASDYLIGFFAPLFPTSIALLFGVTEINNLTILLVSIALGIMIAVIIFMIALGKRSYLIVGMLSIFISILILPGVCFMGFARGDQTGSIFIWVPIITIIIIFVIALLIARKRHN